MHREWTTEQETRTVALEHSPLVIGRSPLGGGGHLDIDLAPDLRGSRRHAWLGVDDAGQWWLEDLGSVNGTRVDERALATQQRVALHPGMRLEVGSTELRLVE